MTLKNSPYASTTRGKTSLSYKAGLHCYTDELGRHKTNGSGIAVFNGSHDSLHTDAAHVGEATVFQAEIHAITMA